MFNLEHTMINIRYLDFLGNCKWCENNKFLMTYLLFLLVALFFGNNYIDSTFVLILLLLFFFELFVANRK